MCWRCWRKQAKQWIWWRKSLAEQSRNYKSVMFDYCWRAYSRCKAPHLWMRRAQSTWAPLGLWQGKPLLRHEGPGPASGRKIFQIQRIVIGQWLIDLKKEEMKDTLRNSSSSVEDQPGLTDLLQLISERYARSAGRRVAMTHHVREATLWPNMNMPECLNATWIFLAPDAAKP